METLRARVEGLGLDALAPIVRSALADEQVSVADRHVHQLDWMATNPVTRGLFRLGGTARRSSGELVPWLVVLKVIGDTDLVDTGYSHEPDDWNYWNREALAFRSDLLDGWPGPLWPVRAFRVDDVGDEVWMWLQACGDARARAPSSVDGLVSTAYDLGSFAAQWASAPPSPYRYPWLARQWVAGWVSTIRSLGVDHAIAHDDCWTTPLVRDVLPPSIRQRMTDLLTNTALLVDRLASLPVTLAHHDPAWSNAFPAQDIGRAAGTVMIDWSFLGLAPVGIDLGLHIGGNLTNGAVGAHLASEHDRSATEAYLRGLREHGWGGPSDAVLFARATSAALVAGTWLTAQASWLCPEMIAIIGDEPSSWPGAMAQEQHSDVATAMAGWATIFDFVLDLGDEAVSLVDQIG